MNTSAALIKWYEMNKRDLPWRNVKDPYIIWLSEIILQQTRVEQGRPYFEKFLHKYPTIQKFAKAKEDDILKMWQGLGYYSRARNMHYTAKEIVKNFNSEFPREYIHLKRLKGIGDYTAAAIASFAFNKPYPVVDGNVHRFLSRYFGVRDHLVSAMAKKKFYTLAEELLDKKSPGLHNQAIMEFGAMQCKPVNPACKICPLISGCYAFAKNKVKLYPTKAKQAKVKERFFNYFYIKHKNKLYIRKRTSNDIWKNLYEFPLIETGKKTDTLRLIKSPAWKSIFGNVTVHVHAVSSDYKHKLSHQTIHARFYEIKLKKKLNEPSGIKFLEIDTEDLKNYGVSRLTERFLRQTFH